jgi:hypothetical protein
MASLTAYALLYVNAVIKVTKVRQIVHPGPEQRLASPIAVTHGFKHRTLSPNLGMASHAGLGRRYPRKSRLFHRGMTVTTVQPEALDVMFMAEGYWLCTDYLRLGDIWRAVNSR